jgi:hypothetical protein
LDKGEEMSVTAKIIVTLEINSKSNWNDDVMASQVKKQASEDAVNELSRLTKDASYRIKIVGEPKVQVVTFDV